VSDDDQHHRVIGAIPIEPGEDAQRTHAGGAGETDDEGEDRHAAASLYPSRERSARDGPHASTCDFLGHTNLTTTSRYLRSTALRLERALRVLEESQAASERTRPMVCEDDSGRSATSLLHGPIGAYDVDDALDAETLDAIEVGVVSPIGASWNRLDAWLRQVDGPREAA
jgi:hypothetical protein